MIAFLDKNGDPEKIKEIIDTATQDSPGLFPNDFMNRFELWKEDIPGGNGQSPQALEFIKKIIREFWAIIYKDGTPHKQIFFEEEVEPMWPEDSRRN